LNIAVVKIQWSKLNLTTKVKVDYGG